jgi:hypothetical protein
LVSYSLYIALKPCVLILCERFFIIYMLEFYVLQDFNKKYEKT